MLGLNLDIKTVNSIVKLKYLEILYKIWTLPPVYIETAVFKTDQKTIKHPLYSAWV